MAELGVPTMHLGTGIAPLSVGSSRCLVGLRDGRAVGGLLVGAIAAPVAPAALGRSCWALAALPVISALAGASRGRYAVWPRLTSPGQDDARARAAKYAARQACRRGGVVQAPALGCQGARCSVRL